jgi:PhzF family phenazine biosynthesis protein
MGKRKLTLETRVGVLSVEVEEQSGDFVVWLTQAEPEFSPGIERGEAAYLLGIKEEELGSLPLEVASTGLPALVVHLAKKRSLREIRPKLEDIAQACSRVDAAGIYAFALSGSEAEARFFAPLCGIPEDPVTGTAAGALLAYLLRHRAFTGRRLVVRQGRFMGREGTVLAEPRGNRVRVGGFARTFLRGEILVP